MKLSEILKENSLVHLATIDIEQKPKSRVISHQFISDGMICFATSNQGNLYRELQENNSAALSQFDNLMYVKVSGAIKFVTANERMDLLQQVAQANPRIVELYTQEGFYQKMEIAYFVNPQVKVMDYHDRSVIEVELD